MRVRARVRVRVRARVRVRVRVRVSLTAGEIRSSEYLRTRSISVYLLGIVPEGGAQEDSRPEEDTPGYSLPDCQEVGTWDKVWAGQEHLC